MKPAARMRLIQPFHVMALLGRARELEAAGRSIIHMEIGEPDFVTPQPVIDAGIRALAEGCTHYTPAVGLAALRERIAGFYADRYHISVEPERIVVTPGASAALQLVMALQPQFRLPRRWCAGRYTRDSSKRLPALTRTG
jgi:aspartate/methionine/tyrosine aminotransferase